MTTPAFPPLFSSLAAPGGANPFDVARAHAARGCDPGLVVYDLGADTLRAAMVLAPEVSLADAVAMLPLCAVGFQNAIGALAPPEIAVHLEWPGGLRINGASCGQLRAAASTDDPNAEPDWLVVDLEVPLWPQSDDPGHDPDRTALYAEGCADVDAVALLESWVKHTLVGINRWLDEGPASLHAEWCGLAHGIGEQVDVMGQTGTFVGVDERFGMLLKVNETTHLIPLTELLEND